jgi:histone H3/H4
MAEEQHFISMRAVRKAMHKASPGQHITPEALKFLRDDLEEYALKNFSILSSLLNRTEKKTITVADVRIINQLKKLV